MRFYFLRREELKEMFKFWVGVIVRVGVVFIVLEFGGSEVWVENEVNFVYRVT